MTTITPAMKVIMAGAGVGLVGGIVAERVMSPGYMDRARAGDRWSVLHDDFIRAHPAPAGTHVRVSREHEGRGAAIAALGGVALAGAGLGVFHLASRMNAGAGFLPLGVAGLTLAAAGGAAFAGASGSWAVR